MNVEFEQDVAQIMRHGVPRSPQFVLNTPFELHAYTPKTYSVFYWRSVYFYSVAWRRVSVTTSDLKSRGCMMSGDDTHTHPLSTGIQYHLLIAAEIVWKCNAVLEQNNTNPPPGHTA